MIFNLPDLVLQTIQCFLTPRSLLIAEMSHTSTANFEWELVADDYSTEEIEEDRPWRNLMNATKQANEIKRKTIYLVLKDDFALRYMNDEIFRDRVDGLVYNRRNQLQIRFEQQPTYESFLIRNGSWDGCHKMKLQYFNTALDLSMLQNVRVLSLHKCQGNGTICNMNTIETLELSECNGIEVISNCPRLIHLNVYCCANLRDISNLINLTTLSVTVCPQLTIQEKTLQSVQYLWLGDEMKTFPSHNMKSFKRLKHLSIMNKDVVLDDLWQLDNLLSLHFYTCQNIKVTRLPKNLKELFFWESNQISPIDFSYLPHLRSLKYGLSSMTEYVIDVPTYLKTVSFLNCFNLTNIYVKSLIKEIVIDDSVSSTRNSSKNTTLWIRRGVSMPNLTLKDYKNFSLKVMC